MNDVMTPAYVTDSDRTNGPPHDAVIARLAYRRTDSGCATAFEWLR